ncbi:MAG: NADP-dependent malic enzyme [Rhizobiaceae bacterium]|nr:NADP-dependent malic enzyme [Rhizobiaceae bacterium]
MAKSPKGSLRDQALHYHEFPKAGKLEIRPTKPLATPSDLSLAYSPGVAEACLAIHENPLDASRFTAKGNLVAVVSNGSAALGLGNIGALASKPIMEGKAVLFKQFAQIDCFDIELDESDPEKFAEHVIALEPTFGAINLEDIKAPDCFIIEKICKERMNIPVFHDDQHGTAIVVGAAAKNALHLAGKRFEDIKIVSTGGGAAGIACLDMLVKLGVKRENIWLCDIAGLVTKGRTEEMTPQKEAYAQASDKTTLDEVIDGADLFLGLSGAGVLKQEMVQRMAEKPIIFALANPNPEIMPEDVTKVAPDAIVATGRSDYPNQVNNVLCFPFIFRGALDVGATTINDEMKIACVDGIAALARKTSSAEAAEVYGDETLQFGPEYLIPKPFDLRLVAVVAGAVARAAMETGVATRPVENIDDYIQQLTATVYRSSMIMRPVFETARDQSRRIAFAEGEDERVLRTALAMLEDSSDHPILIGRPEIIEHKCRKFGFPADITNRFEIVNPESDSRYRDYWETYHSRMKRRGISPTLAQAVLRTNTTVIASVMVARGEADSLICGTFGNYQWHLNYVEQMLRCDGFSPIGALSLLILNRGPIFVADTQVNAEPTAQQIADTVIGMARHIRRFRIEPKIAVCSNSQFGTLDTESARRMREALEILDAQELDFVYEGEMPVDAALDPEIRQRILPDSRLEGKANAFVFSNAETAGGVKNSLKSVTDGIEVGPILMGMGNRAHIVTPSITVRGLINVAALAGTPMQTYG